LGTKNKSGKFKFLVKFIIKMLERVYVLEEGDSVFCLDRGIHVHKTKKNERLKLSAMENIKVYDSQSKYYRCKIILLEKKIKLKHNEFAKHIGY